METRFKKYRGWDGTIYRVQMTREEIKARTRLEEFLGVVVVTPVLFIIFVLASGIIKL